MKTFSKIIVLTFVLALAACAPQKHETVGHVAQEERESGVANQEQAHDEQQEATGSSETGTMKGKGVYANFSKNIIGNGKMSVLFFHATWCGECQRDDKALRQWQASGGLPIDVYEIDYDTSAELKNRYGVVQQNTYVVIDGEGKALSSVSFPGIQGLQSLLTKNAQ